MKIEKIGPRTKDLTGMTFGRLTVLGYAGRFGKRKITHWFCSCVCGNIKKIAGTNLKGGCIVSCGCYSKEVTREIGKKQKKHGLHGSRTYIIWNGMKLRCNNESNASYKNYGGKGVGYCESWEKFENFLKDMGKAPEDLTLERIDSNKNYSKENCKWASWKEQARNKSTNRIIEHNGKSMILKDWSIETGFSEQVILGRLNRGWTIEDALTKPVQKKRRRNST